MARVFLLHQFSGNSLSRISSPSQFSSKPSSSPPNSINFNKTPLSSSLKISGRARRGFRVGAVTEDDSGPAKDEAGAAAVAEAEEPVVKEPTEIELLKKQLVDLFYGTDRGLRATSETRAEIVELITKLEAKNPTPAPTEALTLLNGKWILAYTSFVGLFPLLSRTLSLVKVEEISQTIDSENFTVQNSVLFSGPLATTSLRTNAKFEVRSPKRVQEKEKEKEKEKKSKVKVPKVPVRVRADPEDETENENEEEKVEMRWLNLKELLYKYGVLFLTDEITKKRGNDIIRLLIHLAIHNPTQEVLLFLNCVAGSARTAIAIFDAMQSLPSNINTIGCGMTAGVGSFILLSGDMRLGYPHVRVMMHKPKCKIFHWKKATMKDHLEKLNECQRIDNAIYEIFVARTGQPYDVIKQDMKDKLCMSAKEAQDYGIIDLITSEFNFDLY